MFSCQGDHVLLLSISVHNVACMVIWIVVNL